jgi:hypothetical protein
MRSTRRFLVALVVLAGGLALPPTAAAVETVPAEVAASPSPVKSPGLAPLLPPAGLPTAPPPDSIKPVEPQAGPDSRELAPAAAGAGGA